VPGVRERMKSSVSAGFSLCFPARAASDDQDVAVGDVIDAEVGNHAQSVRQPHHAGFRSDGADRNVRRETGAIDKTP
jgi:hypothetical protein